ncbi:hypothetical protein CK203_105831 [Vitis vinifera]|uniref:Uncharacterized protein n=1 Tax=Vitis vinifera TaxID=29760 RepID=A0A438CYV5_VITVI|nr:hypothetical protein CK203_105831 [Vitis vinifera]
MYLPTVKMTSSSRSRSSARGDKGYFEWRSYMERRQRENERQMQILLQETRRLREENNVLRIQSYSQPQHYQRRQDPCRNQEVPLPREASPTLGAHEAWPNETPVHANHVRRDESSGSTRVSSKRQREKRPQISDATRARLGPQTFCKNRPHTTISLEAHSEPSSSPTLQGHAARPPSPPVTRVGKDPSHTAPPRSSNRGQGERRPPLIRTPLTKSYKKLLPIISDLPGFRWPVPMKLNPSERDRNKRCDYHKDHGHNIETCRSLHYMVEDILKAGHLKHSVVRQGTRAQPCRHPSSNPMDVTLGHFGTRAKNWVALTPEPKILRFNPE